jgi:4'-phosphopantetheinyl transferase EntD
MSGERWDASPRRCIKNLTMADLLRTDGMICELLPPGVASVECFGDVEGVTLFAEEESVIERAVDGRRRAFATARHCARQALGTLGITPVPIPRGERGCPCWPDEVVGSITHCSGYRAAVAARTATAAAIGIDALPAGPLPRGVLPRVASLAEREHVAELGQHAPGVSWERLLFSAKEALYKALYPLTRAELGFSDASVTFDSETFTAVVTIADPIHRGARVASLGGRWLARDDLLVTAVVLQEWTQP